MSAVGPSMKVPPKRKGNVLTHDNSPSCSTPSMKVPPKRKGNITARSHIQGSNITLNESPSEKEGK